MFIVQPEDGQHLWPKHVVVIYLIYSCVWRFTHTPYSLVVYGNYRSSL